VDECKPPPRTCCSTSGEGLPDITRRIIGCHFSQYMRIQNASKNVAGNIGQALHQAEHRDCLVKVAVVVGAAGPAARELDRGGGGGIPVVAAQVVIVSKV